MYSYTDTGLETFVSYIMAFLVIAFIVNYLISVYPMYVMYKRANLKNPWVAFIPVIGGLKILNLANLSMWWYLGLILISLIPYVGALAVFLFSLYLVFKVCQNFGIGVFGIILAIFFAIFVYWYIVLTKKPFIAEINPKFTN